MNILVTYASKYGSTERYARWIAEALHSDLRKASKIRAKDLAQYDVIIHGGGLYAGGLSGISVLTKNFEALSDKHLILFSCGIADPTDPRNEANIKAGIARSLTPEMQAKIKQFHLRGGLDYSRLSLLHRFMMAGLRGHLLKLGYENLRGEDKLLVDTYGGKVDYSDQGTITPLVEYIRNL